MKKGKILFFAAAFFAAAVLLSAQAPDPYKIFNSYRGVMKYRGKDVRKPWARRGKSY